jgi:hypothetical protein
MQNACSGLNFPHHTHKKRGEQRDTREKQYYIKNIDVGKYHMQVKHLQFMTISLG